MTRSMFHYPFVIIWRYVFTSGIIIACSFSLATNFITMYYNLLLLSASSNTSNSIDTVNNSDNNFSQPSSNRIVSQQVQNNKSNPPMARKHRRSNKITIIIGTLNDSQLIGRTLRNLEYTTADKAMVDIVIVDGGSTDNTLDLAKASTCAIPVKYIKAEKLIIAAGTHGRGVLYNIGLRYTTGELVMLLSPDTLLPQDYDIAVRKKFQEDPRHAIVTFRYGIEKIKQSEISLGLTFFEWFVNLRTSRCLLPTMQQGVAMTTSDFEKSKFANCGNIDLIEFLDRIRLSVIREGRSLGIVDEVALSPLSGRSESINLLRQVLKDAYMQLLLNFSSYSPNAISSLLPMAIPNSEHRRSRLLSR